METTDMQAIREALLKINSILRTRDGIELPLRTVMQQKCNDAIAILDKIDKSGEGVRGTGMVLTDEEIGRFCDSADFDRIVNGDDGLPDIWQVRFDAIQAARDNFILSAPAKAPAEVAPSPQAVTVEGKWISVDDEMPEELETVWLANPKHNIVFLGCWSQEADGVWCWAASNGTTYVQGGRIVAECEDDDLDVTHWMRLPLPLPSAPASTNT